MTVVTVIIIHHICKEGRKVNTNTKERIDQNDRGQVKSNLTSQDIPEDLLGIVFIYEPTVKLLGC